MRSIAIAAVLVAGLGLSACGTTTIDSDKAETEISKGYEQQVPGSSVDEVDCPDTIEAEAGVTATCKLTLADGNAGDINLRVLDEDGNIRWDVANPAG